MASGYSTSTSHSMSSQRVVVTKTIKTTGPDGKLQSYTTTEEKFINDGDTTQTNKKFGSGFGNFFSSKKITEPKSIKSGKKSSTSSSDEDEIKTKSSGFFASGGQKGAAESKPSQSLAQFHAAALKKHNEYRAQHDAPPLTLNKAMCAYAQEWAEQMAKSGRFAHRPDRKYGENIYYGMNSRGVSAEDAIDSWYNEVELYNFSRQGFSSGTGHFTQVVWKGSKELGIGRAEPKPGTVYVVANYNPPGNVMGHFDQNVAPKKKGR